MDANWLMLIEDYRCGGRGTVWWMGSKEVVGVAEGVYVRQCKGGGWG